MTAEVVIYTKSTCPFCIKAKGLLSKKGVQFTEIEITGNNALRQEMIAKASGRETVPQIFINGEHIGGCDDLFACDSSGKLDQKLAA